MAIEKKSFLVKNSIDVMTDYSIQAERSLATPKQHHPIAKTRTLIGSELWTRGTVQKQGWDFEKLHLLIEGHWNSIDRILNLTLWIIRIDLICDVGNLNLPFHWD